MSGLPDAGYRSPNALAAPEEAWRRMLSELPAGEGSAIVFSTEQPDDQRPRLTQWPGFQQVWAQPDEGWIARYEQCLMRLSQSARKQGSPQTGVFYTPAPVTRYLVERSLGRFLQERLSAIHASGSEKTRVATQALAEVRQLRIIDPGCGTGIFLKEALRLLAGFYAELAHTPPYSPELAHLWIADILTHQLYGMDVDPLAVAIAETRLLNWLKVHHGPEAVLSVDYLSFSAHWHVGDTLLTPPDVFPNAPAWSFILGNPPYVSQVRKQSGRFRELQESGPYYRAKMDLCDAFVAWSLDRLTPGGQLALVLPEYWTQRTGAKPIRQRLWSEGLIREFRTFPQTPLFPEAPGHHSSLLVWERFETKRAGSVSMPLEIHTAAFSDIGHAERLRTDDLIQGGFWLDERSSRLFYGDTTVIALLKRLGEHPPLLNARDIRQGIVLPQGRIAPDGRRTRPKHRFPHLETNENAVPVPDEIGVFLLTDDELNALNLNAAEMEMIRPYYQPGGFQAYAGFGATPATIRYHLIYGDVENRRRMQKEPATYARLRSHLERVSAINTSAFAPYGLHRARQVDCFEGKNRILGLRQAKKPHFAVVRHPVYVNESFYILKNQPNPALTTALLNSNLAHFWFYHQKRKGHRLQIDKEVLVCFPAPASLSEDDTAALATLSQRLTQIETPEKTDADQRALNTVAYRAYGLKPAEVNLIEERVSFYQAASG